jgi:hypothetical protein
MSVRQAKLAESLENADLDSADRLRINGRVPLTDERG